MAEPHPIMFRDDDFGLDEVRSIALAFPGAVETVSHGRPWFRTTTGFAVFGGGTRGPDKRRYPSAVLVKVEEGHKVPLLADPRFFDPAYLGAGGWVGLDLTAADVDWQEVAELVDESFRLTAPKKLVRRLDDEGGPADRR
ncbi:MmcQ/YjbR family DNA-binding protein [Amnibacterium flavum]|uniref:Phosphoribosylglycinamide formyltransferase n=1 Tax=Amnibacterium flavum TaxID=2173173 RepID=A0A2V1HM48_9MICO|nr:MmcQ/YjbR family DNA-binding protein [Amnibacterium flavum]PVZ93693.1 phosphoribosylglycinamide formyltransferase [Amnibacterium flavum]